MKFVQNRTSARKIKGTYHVVDKVEALQRSVESRCWAQIVQADELIDKKITGKNSFPQKHLKKKEHFEGRGGLWSKLVNTAASASARHHQQVLK